MSPLLVSFPCIRSMIRSLHLLPTPPVAPPLSPARRSFFLRSIATFPAPSFRHDLPFSFSLLGPRRPFPCRSVKRERSYRITRYHIRPARDFFARRTNTSELAKRLFPIRYSAKMARSRLGSPSFGWNCRRPCIPGLRLRLFGARHFSALRSKEGCSALCPGQYSGWGLSARSLGLRSVTFVSKTLMGSHENTW